MNGNDWKFKDAFPPQFRQKMIFTTWTWNESLSSVFNMVEKG